MYLLLKKCLLYSTLVMQSSVHSFSFITVQPPLHTWIRQLPATRIIGGIVATTILFSWVLMLIKLYDNYQHIRQLNTLIAQHETIIEKQKKDMTASQENAQKSNDQLQNNLRYILTTLIPDYPHLDVTADLKHTTHPALTLLMKTVRIRLNNFKQYDVTVSKRTGTFTYVRNMRNYCCNAYDYFLPDQQLTKLNNIWYTLRSGDCTIQAGALITRTEEEDNNNNMPTLPDRERRITINMNDKNGTTSIYICKGRTAYKLIDNIQKIIYLPSIFLEHAHQPNSSIFIMDRGVSYKSKFPIKPHLIHPTEQET